MTITGARIVSFDGESEEETFRFEQLLGNTCTVRTDEIVGMIGEVGLDQDDRMLAGLMRFWEQDELGLIEEEQEGEAGAAMRLVKRTWNELIQLMRGWRQVEAEDEEAHGLDRWTMDFVRRIVE
jgi:hypothetical protein